MVSTSVDVFAKVKTSISGMSTILNDEAGASTAGNVFRDKEFAVEKAKEGEAPRARHLQTSTVTTSSGTSLDFYYNGGWCDGSGTADECDAIADVDEWFACVDRQGGF